MVLKLVFNICNSLVILIIFNFSLFLEKIYISLIKEIKNLRYVTVLLSNSNTYFLICNSFVIRNNTTMNFDSVNDKIKRFRRLFSCFFKKFENFTPKIAFFMEFHSYSETCNSFVIHRQYTLRNM